MSSLDIVMAAAGSSGVPTGQAEYTTAGTYSWTCPAGVTSVSVVCVGAGGTTYFSNRRVYSSCGGALAYRNNIAVVPGTSYTVTVAAAGGGFSSYSSCLDCGAGSANMDQPGVPFGTYNGGGSGGLGIQGGGGGGAGGYSGNGGDGGSAGGSAGASNSGAGGGGGGSGYGGGGVGILGKGTTGGSSGTGSDAYGRGGSGGTNGANGSAGLYGGGPGADGSGTAKGAVGAVRIIWPGTTRQFPSTNTGDM